MNFDTQACRAVITGASSGLGAEFARQLAPQAELLFLTGRRMDALAEVRATCQQINPALRVEICACDLATDEGRAQLLEALTPSDLKLNLLINNAGMGDYGTVASADASKIRAQMDLNMDALVLLTHAMLPRLQRPAGILNVSSLASALPLPALAVYAATKAFVTSFSEALAIELAAENITVSCVCPGPTPTQFSATAQRAGGEDVDRGGQDLLRIPPETVVATALRGLRAGKPCIYPGRGVRIAATLFRHLPRVWLRWLLRLRFSRN